MFLSLLITNLNAKNIYSIDKKILTSLEQEFGVEAKSRVVKLINLLNAVTLKNETYKLKAINDFFNTIEFSGDMKTWGVRDYWASRDEFLGIDEGDCEDYVIAKYFSLIQLGIPVERLYLTYVKAIKYKQSHMVLTYYKSKGSVPLVLDNINHEILPSTSRNDLRPLFSFNGEKIYMAKQRGLGKVIPQGKVNLMQWSNLILKIKREQQ